MKGQIQKQKKRSRVVKVVSKKSWDFHLNQATSCGYLVVANFTAAWCMPSVAMKPVFNELATKFQEAVFVTVDVDEVKDVALKYGVKAMPTFLLLKDGAPVHKLVGANPHELRKKIEKLVRDATTVSPASI